jgi:signal transduction histidine kinase
MPDGPAVHGRSETVARSRDTDPVLVLAPVGRDASLATEILTRAGIPARACTDVLDLCTALEAGAGAMLLTQEALAAGASDRIIDALRNQPSWSDVPMIVLVRADSHGPGVLVQRLLETEEANMTILERPVRSATLVSTCQTALRARRRQYELRDQLQALARAEADERRALDRARQLQTLTVQLGRNLETEVLFEQVVDAVAELLEVAVVGLYLLEHPEADFISAAARGLEPGHLGSRLPRHTSLAGRSVDERRAVGVDDVSRAENVVLPRLLGGASVGAVAVAPIEVEGEQLGAVEVYSPMPRRWNADDLELLTAFAAAVAVAINNARHHEREQQAIRARDDFLAAASHDLKNPLTAIRGGAQMLERTYARLGTVPEDRLTSSIRTISGSAARMTALIDELLDVSRLRMGESLPLERSPSDLVDIARQLASMHQAAAEHHQIVVETAAPEVVGEWDSRRLQRAVENLLSNAIKYSPDGGEVTIRIHQEADTAVLAVLDHGMGIPTADLPQVFDRFRRGTNVLGRIEGTGIGLAAAAQIVQEHGGSIDLQSQEGEGTTVTIRLPVSLSSATEPRHD